MEGTQRQVDARPGRAPDSDWKALEEDETVSPPGVAGPWRGLEGRGWRPGSRETFRRVEPQSCG